MPGAARSIVSEQQTARLLKGASASATRERVEEAACLPLLRARRLFGQGVAIAVVDEGIHVESLLAKLRAAPGMDEGPFPSLDVENSTVAALPEPFARWSHQPADSYSGQRCWPEDLPT